MYHPSRGGVRGGRDQFNWDDVKADKHRENYLGHSLKAPVGRWQKGKDLMWYARDKNQMADEAAASAREEIERVKQEEEEAMREALGLAPRRDNKPRGNRLDKREQEELLKRSKAGEEVEKPYAQGERVQGLGFAPAFKSEAPDKKDLLQREAAPEEEGPLAQIISHAHKEAENAEPHEPIADTVKDDSPQESDELDKKRKRKEEKRAAKEQRREEKRAAKKIKREKRRRQTSISSDEKLVDREGSRAKLRRHDSSDEEHGHNLSRKDTLSRRGRGRGSSDDAAPRVNRKTHDGRGSDESDEDVPERPSASRFAPGQKGEHTRTTLGRDSRNSHDDHRDEKGRRASVANDRSVEEDSRSRRGDEGTRDGEHVKGRVTTTYHAERERKHGSDSPRQRHKYDVGDDKGRRGKYSGAYSREVVSLRRGRDSDSDEDTRRRQKGGNEFRRQEGRDELSRRGDRHYSKDNGRHYRRSPSPVRRKPRHDSD